MAGHDFLRVYAFLSTEIDARAIKSAIELGVIDALNGQPLSFDMLSAQRKLNPVGLRLLLNLLEVNNVVACTEGAFELTPAFKAALSYRDLLECRIAFSDLVWPDIHNLFTPLLNDLPQFMARSKVFALFRYDRCVEISPENLAAASAWTRFTTCLTKYETQAVLDDLDLGSMRSLTDFGGNTGEFALQVCRRNPMIEAVVVDLPVVCALGRQHIAATATAAEAARISFFPADMRSQALPPPADLVSFKSVLHDWPDADAVRLLERASGSVRPGGRAMIFERGPIEVSDKRIPYSMASDLVFLHFLRPADLYVNTLKKLGFVAIEYRRIELEMGFHFITARLPA
jgi:SAM-dependent methyltransferase